MDQASWLLRNIFKDGQSLLSTFFARFLTVIILRRGNPEKRELINEEELVYSERCPEVRLCINKEYISRKTILRFYSDGWEKIDFLQHESFRKLII